MEKIRTSCCALAQIAGVGNGTTTKELKERIDNLKIEKLLNTEVGFTTGNGQTAIFIIASPRENKLKAKLVDLGFKLSHSFERRVGYPNTGDLKMYIKNL